MLRSYRLLLAVLLLPLFWIGCDGEKRESSADDGTLMEALRQLGYVKYSSEADDRRGVTIHDRARAEAGVNLFTDDQRIAMAMDMDGNVLHRWEAPESFNNCEYFELLDDANIVAVCAGSGLVRLDRDSNVVWKLEGRIHHDVAPVGDGSFLVPNALPNDDRPIYSGHTVNFDDMLHVSAAGEPLDRWRIWDNFERIHALHDSLPLDEGGVHAVARQKYDYYHLNSIEVLPDTPLGRRDDRFRAGNRLLSLRNANLIIILDPLSDEIVWSWGPGEIELQHMPTMLPNGNILLFDNGSSRGWSRIVELRPDTKQIVWEYRGDPPESFLTKWRGSSQRMPGGNTLICQSDMGRVFEVTSEGEIVWEFWSPNVHEGKRLGIYRFLRIPNERAAMLLELPVRATDDSGSYSTATLEDAAN